MRRRRRRSGGDYPDTEHVRFRTLPAVTFASATFRGPYDKIRAANAAVAAWVRDNGYAFDGPASIFTTSIPARPTTRRSTSPKCATR